MFSFLSLWMETKAPICAFYITVVSVRLLLKVLNVLESSKILSSFHIWIYKVKLPFLTWNFLEFLLYSKLSSSAHELESFLFKIPSQGVNVWFYWIMESQFLIQFLFFALKKLGSHSTLNLPMVYMYIVYFTRTH